MGLGLGLGLEFGFETMGGSRAARLSLRALRGEVIGEVGEGRVTGGGEGV